MSVTARTSGVSPPTSHHNSLLLCHECNCKNKWSKSTNISSQLTASLPWCSYQNEHWNSSINIMSHSLLLYHPTAPTSCHTHCFYIILLHQHHVTLTASISSYCTNIMSHSLLLYHPTAPTSCHTHCFCIILLHQHHVTLTASISSYCTNIMSHSLLLYHPTAPTSCHTHCFCIILLHQHHVTLTWPLYRTGFWTLCCNRQSHREWSPGLDRAVWPDPSTCRSSHLPEQSVMGYNTGVCTVCIPGCPSQLQLYE